MKILTPDEKRRSSLLDHLAGMPRYGHGTATTREVRQIMLDTGGEMMACGHLYDIVAKSLGAGVHRISLRRKEYPS